MRYTQTVYNALYIALYTNMVLDYALYKYRVLTMRNTHTGY